MLLANCKWVNETTVQKEFPKIFFSFWSKRLITPTFLLSDKGIRKFLVVSKLIRGGSRSNSGVRDY